MDDLRELLRRAEESGRAYALALVTNTEGSTSGKPGAKAVILEDGSVLGGWVGGGCVESTVIIASREAIQSGLPRTVILDLTDEFTGLGMPCGGRMWVYIEPSARHTRLVVLGNNRIAQALARLATAAGFAVIVDDTHATPSDFSGAMTVISDDSDYTRFPVDANTFVVVATHHKGDDLAIEAAVRKGARYIALIASRKRADIVLDNVVARGVPREALAAVRSPAGLDLGAETPEEIAVSIVAEILYETRKKACCPISLSLARNMLNTRKEA